jgi:hypothetical protein
MRRIYLISEQVQCSLDIRTNQSTGEFGLSNRSDYWFSNKKKVLVKLFIQKIYRYILYTNNDRKPRMSDHTPGSGQAITGLHLSTPGEVRSVNT